MSNKGAIPGLGESLSTPEAATKAKTNVSSFKILVLVIAGFLFIILALMLYAKNRQPTMAATPETELARPNSYTEKNAEIGADNIDGQKAKIREEEEKREAAEAKMRAEIEEAQRRAREEELLRLQQKGGGEIAPAETEEDRAMRTDVLLPLTGTARKGANEGSGGGGARQQSSNDLSTEEQRAREVDARMRKAGVNPGAAPAGGFASGDGESLGGRLKPSSLPSVTAGHLGDLTFLLKKGTTIPCALKTGIDTQLPGFVVCNVINDVYSANGETLLIERGATLFGEQQSSLRQGQERTFVIWTRIDNPSGVSANLDSPAVDQMGYSGIPGIVDGHFWKRFGGAILLTTIKEFTRAVADRYANRGNGGFYGGSSDMSNDMDSMATEALKSTINIPPTLIVKPATVVYVMVARDVSFESVYDLIR